VILNDWRREPQISASPQLLEEIDEMQVALARCKSILGGILTSAGETRGEAPGPTTVRDFLDDLVADWRFNRPSAQLGYEDRFGPDLPIVSDTALKQTICNVLDNAADVSPSWIEMCAERRDDALLITVTDRGPGFSDAMLANLGKPYSSTKDKQGGGLGLFLVVNVMRKLGGGVAARNLGLGLRGAQVTLTLPLASLALAEETADA
jgi:two-component system sensor histidine kinase RegB